jgi:predicted dehydrogenase
MSMPESTPSFDDTHGLPPVAVIGCGAAAREFVLPVLRKYAEFAGSVVLVDQQLERAAAVAREFAARHVASDFRSLPIDVRAAIITTPHHWHAPQAIHFLEQGKHVFVEKPLAVSAADATNVVQAAAASKAIVMVNNYRRLFPSYRRVRELLESGELGSIRRISIQDGTKFAWQSATGFYVREARARGVLLDRGAHTVDVLCWWLAQRPEVVVARHDAWDGVEGLMDVQLACGAATIDLKFSRFHRLSNSYSIQGDEATIGGRLFDFGRLQLLRSGRGEWIDAGKPRPHYEYAWQLVHNFVRAIQGHEAPWFRAQDVVPSIAVIDEAYRRATRFDTPWYDSDRNIQWLKQN